MSEGPCSAPRSSSRSRWASSSSWALLTSSSSSSAIRSRLLPYLASKSCSDESFSLFTGSARDRGERSSDEGTSRSFRGRRCRAPCRAACCGGPSRTRGGTRARAACGSWCWCGPAARQCTWTARQSVSSACSPTHEQDRNALSSPPSRRVPRRAPCACSSRSPPSAPAPSRVPPAGPGCSP